MITNGKLRCLWKVVELIVSPLRDLFLSNFDPPALPQLFYNVNYSQQGWPSPILDPQHIYHLKEAIPDIPSSFRKAVSSL